MKYINRFITILFFVAFGRTQTMSACSSFKSQRPSQSGQVIATTPEQIQLFKQHRECLRAELSAQQKKAIDKSLYKLVRRYTETTGATQGHGIVPKIRRTLKGNELAKIQQKLDRGADPDCFDYIHNHEEDRHDLLVTLINAGMNLEASRRSMPPLCDACQYGTLKTVQLLVDSKAPVNAMHWRVCPMDFAKNRRSDSQACVKILLEVKADADFQATVFEGEARHDAMLLKYGGYPKLAKFGLTDCDRHQWAHEQISAVVTPLLNHHFPSSLTELIMQYYAPTWNEQWQQLQADRAAAATTQASQQSDTQ
jgi:hypothetical protein